MDGQEQGAAQLPHVERSAVPALALRPTFALQLDAPPHAVIGALRAQLAASRLDVRWAKVPGRGPARSDRPHCHGMVAVPANEQRFWSPWLFLDVHAEAGGERGDGAEGTRRRTEIVGCFAPHPSVWTGFAFAAMVAAILTIAGLIGGMAQASLDRPPSALWLVAVAGAAGLALWLAARLGQRLGRGQMATLRAAIEEAATCATPGAAAAAGAPGAEATAPRR